jgi:hypothetical protein
MARARSHKDVEYAVNDASGRERIFKSADEAAGFAIALALSDGRHHDIDVLVYSRAGAVWYGGDSGGFEYDEDPEASVFYRIRVDATSHGRVP